MKAKRNIVMALFWVAMILGCAPTHYSTVSVRPATCSHDVQFSSAESFWHLLEFADKMRKPVFMHFTVPAMENCRRMDEYVFKQNEMASYYNSHFINYRINVASSSIDQRLADQYGITHFPSQVFVDGKGK